MWGLHLKQRGKWWHYYRAVPRRFQDVDARSQICFALKTTDFNEAKVRAAQISLDLELEWKRALELGTSLKSQDAVRRYASAADVQLQSGFKPQTSTNFSNEELLQRLHLLLASDVDAQQQKAVLGLVEKPKLSMMDAYVRFWDHIEDEWSVLSHDQRRVKRNGYLKALSNFQDAVGDVKMYEVERHHAMTFRAWWLKRIKAKGLKPHTGNKDINALRRMITTNYDIDAIQMTNPLARIRLKDEVQSPRQPFMADQIREMIKSEAMPKTPPEFCCLLKLLVNTGMRPVEAIGLELDDVILQHDVPHVHVRKNAVRGLKTAHSERLLPLLGVSLDAAHELAAMGGWASGWVRAMAIANDFSDLYGMGCIIDEDELLANPEGHFKEMMYIWAQYQDDPNVPSPKSANFLTELYWYALKKTTLAIAKDVGLRL